MHDSCINYVFLCMPRTEWREEKQPTSHRILLLIIWLGFDPLLLEQKADKITRIFFLPMHISFRRQSQVFCLENKFTQLIFQVGIVLLWHVPKNTHMTLGILYILLCTLFQKQSRVVLIKISWKFTEIWRIELGNFEKSRNSRKKLLYFKHVLYQQPYLQLTANFTCKIFL